MDKVVSCRAYSDEIVQVDFRQSKETFELKKIDSFDTVKMNQGSVASELDFNIENASMSDVTSIHLSELGKS